MLASLGGRVARVLVVGCEPESVAEGIGLSEVVAAAVPRAVELVHRGDRRSSRAGEGGVESMSGLIKLAILAGVIGIVVVNAPDIKRYIKISRM